MPPEHRSSASTNIEALFVGSLFFAVGLFGVVYGARRWLPPLASRHGAGIDAMLMYLLFVTGGLFLIGHLVLSGLIWRAATGTGHTSTPTARLMGLQPLGLWWSLGEDVGRHRNHGLE